MKKWLKYSYMFAFVPAVVGPAIAITSCDSKKEEKTEEEKKDPAKSNPTDAKPQEKDDSKAQVKQAANRVEVTELQIDNPVKSEASFDQFIDHFAKPDGTFVRLGGLNALLTVLCGYTRGNESYNSYKDSVEEFDVKKTGDCKFAVNFLLKNGHVFKGTNENKWSTGTLNYVQDPNSLNTSPSQTQPENSSSTEAEKISEAKTENQNQETPMASESKSESQNNETLNTSEPESQNEQNKEVAPETKPAEVPAEEQQENNVASSQPKTSETSN